MLAWAILVSVIFLVLVSAPFIYGEGGSLARNAVIKDTKALGELQRALVKRYVQDEQAHEKGHISKRVWQKRKEFLTNRFIDVSRQKDHWEQIS